MARRCSPIARGSPTWKPRAASAATARWRTAGWACRWSARARWSARSSCRATRGDVAFTPRDQELLTFVAHHIGGGLARKRAQEHLKAAHSELEFRVESRTQELAGANRELRAQIGERMRAEQRLTHQARHDALTGLPNRPHLLERLDNAISQARSREGACFGVLFLDLDRFKLINDSIGHAAGDEMLVEVGRRIAEVLGDTGVVARFGGDEFAILVDPLARAGRERSVGLAHPGSARQAVVDRRPRTVSLGEHRHRACGNRATGWARNCCAMPTPRCTAPRPKAATAARCSTRRCARTPSACSTWKRTCAARSSSDAFIPHFQPIVRLTDGKIVGHEALAALEP